MKTNIQIGGQPVTIYTNIDMEFSANCDRLSIYCGPFIISLGNDAVSRKALIAALIEADAELDAAEEAREVAA